MTINLSSNLAILILVALIGIGIAWLASVGHGLAFICGAVTYLAIRN